MIYQAVAALLVWSPFAALGAYAIWRGRHPVGESGPNWVLEPHRTNPGDIDMGRYQDPFESNIHEDFAIWLDRLRRHQAERA